MSVSNDSPSTAETPTPPRRKIPVEASRVSFFGDISAVSTQRMGSPVDALLQGNSPPSLWLFLEAIIGWAESAFGTEEFARAQQEFFLKTGKIFPDDPFFHERISYFLDHFLFERPLSPMVLQSPAGPITPYYAFCQALDQDPSLAKLLPLKEDLLALGQCRHSLFEVHGLKKKKLVVKDIFKKGEKISITSEPSLDFDAFHSGDLFQGFLFPKTSGDLFLSPGVLFHPYGALKIIKKELKISRKKEGFSPEEQLSWLLALARHQLSALRRKVHDPALSYTEKLALTPS